MIFKKQRYYHSNEAVKDAEKSDKACVYPYRNGKDAGVWIDLPDGEHLNIKEGKIGPATNMVIVTVFSIAGIIAAAFIFAPGIFGG